MRLIKAAPWNFVFVYNKLQNDVRLNNLSYRKIGNSQVEHHDLMIIAADGWPVQPLKVNCFVSASGERYDFVLNTLTNRSISEAFVRVRALGTCAANEIQELARLFIVDDMTKVQKSNADHLPVLDYPPYDKPYKNDIVSGAHLFPTSSSSRNLIIIISFLYS